MKARKRISAQDKAEILKRHLVDKVPVSDLCDEYDIQPSNFYSRQRKLFENAASALEPQGLAKRQKKEEEEEVSALQEKLAKRDEVLAELMQEHVALKKSLGRSEGPLGPSRHTRRHHRLCQRLVGEDRDRRLPLHRLARHRHEQILPVAPALRKGQRAQR